jgi:predicted permease
VRILARAVYRACLVFVPATIRRHYQAEMIATFDAALDGAARRGRVAVVGLLLAEIGDLVRSRRANVPAPLRLPRTRDGTAPGRARFDLSGWVQAFRSLRRRPSYAGAAVLTLAFGTGITATVFSIVDTVLIKPLPYPDGDRLVAVYESSTAAREKTSLVAPARLEDWHRLNRTFVALSGSYGENVTDTSGGEPERLEARRVASRFFAVYATPPIAGRTFTEADERFNGPGAAVISDGFWMRRFGRSPSALGHAVVIGGEPYTIVGVMPAAFTAAVTDVWLPARIPPPLMRVREARFLGGIGRLRADATLDAAARDLAAVQAALAREFPKTDDGWSVEVRSLRDARVGDAWRGLVLVAGAVALLWLIAVANVAGLTLVQVQRRTRELAIRSALGASRGQVLAGLLREGIILAALGGLLGAGIGAWAARLLPALLEATPRMNELAFDWRALAFAASSSLLAVCGYTLVPALAGMRARIAPAISAGRTIPGGRHRLQEGLVVAQVALSVLLVGSATLLLRSYYRLAHLDTGFDAEGVIVFHVGARWDEDRARIGQLRVQLLAELGRLPHVQHAGTTNFLPATGATLRYQVFVSGAGSGMDGWINAGARMISGSYFRAIGAPILAGTGCPPLSTNPNAPRSALVNKQLVDAYAPGQNLVGRSLRMAQAPGAEFTIVGIVGNLAEDGHAAAPAPYVYTCDPAGAWPDPEYLVRTSDPRALAADLRRIVRELDPARAIFGMRPLARILESALDRPKLDSAMLALFASAAVTLAALGLCSLFMLVVAERHREMGVRLAIGAAPRQVVRLIAAGAGRLLTSGLVAGFALMLAADRLLRGLVFDATAFDLPTLAAAAATLAAASAAAVALPALKAARISPLDALREE